MGIEDIQISEELQTNAPSIKYSGNEGPKSPQEMEQMMMAQLEEEYLKYVDDMMEQGLEPMTLEQFMQQAMAEGQMAGGNPLPQDPTKPVNPFAPKPTGPVLPDRQMAAYGGIMGMDGRKQYGIGSWFQKAKDKVVDDLIPNEIKDNPLLTAAALAGGDYLLRGDNSIISKGYDFIKESPVGTKVGEFLGGKVDKNDPKSQTYGDYIKSGIMKNIIPAAGGAIAGLFTKNQEGDNSNQGIPSDNTALQLADLKKIANTLDQKQAMAAGLNFTPAVSARKYSPEEMAVTYAQAANGGRIGYEGGGPTGEPTGGLGLGGLSSAMQQTPETFSLDGSDIQIVMPDNNPTIVGEGMQGGKKILLIEVNGNTMMIPENEFYNKFGQQKAMGGRIGRAEGGIMDLGGMEKDYRAEGGFVPIGREEKADDVPARLSVNEFVFTADAVRNAGGGDIDQGAQVMENMMKHLEQGGQVSEESQGMQGARDMFATSQRLGDVV